MPIFFVMVGFLAGPVLGLLHVEPGDEVLVLLLEAALVMVLFADSSALDVHRWTREPALSGRLLGIGLPLTMLAGALVALVVLFVTILIAVADVATGGESEVTAIATLVYILAVSTVVGLVAGLGGGWL